MAFATDNSWLADIVGAFIHSRVWLAPIHTFIEANCATFDYDDDVTDEDDTTSSPSSSVEEQTNIHEQYHRLVDSLIDGLSNDMSLDRNELRKVCQIPTSADDSPIIDESFEQLYAARNFQLFQEMMRRKNLILQLQALVSLQLQWGLLKQSETGDDLILSLLLQATSSSSRRGSVGPSSELIEEPVENKQLHEKDDRNRQYDDDDDDDVVVVPRKKSPPSLHKKREIEPKKPPKKEYQLPNLRGRGGEADAEWHRDLQRQKQQRHDDDDYATDQSEKTSTPQTIGAISEKALREKLHELTIRTKPTVDDETAAAIKLRQDRLKELRNTIVDKQRAERTLDLEQQSHNARPQSAAHVARKAMSTAGKVNENKQEEQQQPTQISDDELIKRRAMAAKLRREVVDKR